MDYSRGDEITLRTKHAAANAVVPISGTYYIDGTNGDDEADGLSPATAFQTTDFLYSGSSNPMSRVLQGNLYIYILTDVFSSGTSHHTIVDNFMTLNGFITLEGVPTDIITDIVVTGWDNTVSSLSYHTYLDASGESLTVDAHSKDFIEITTGTGSGSLLYPILSNTATHLETVALPDMDGTSRAKIVRLPKFKGATTAAPTTNIDYSLTPFEFKNNDVNFKIEKIDFTDVLNYNQNISMHDNKDMILRYDNTDQIFRLDRNDRVNIISSHMNYTNYTWLSSTNFNDVVIGSTIINSSDSTGYGLYIENTGKGTLLNNRIVNQLVALSSDGQGFINILTGNLFEDCWYAIQPVQAMTSICAWASGATLKFNNCTTAINMTGAPFLFGTGLTIYHSGVTNQIQVSDNLAYNRLFSDLTAKKAIRNASSGASVVYSDPITFEIFHPQEEVNEINTLTTSDTAEVIYDTYHLDGSSGPVTLTLPSANGTPVMEWVIKATDTTNTVKIVATENIDGTSGATGHTFTSQWEIVVVYSDGTQFYLR